MMSNRDLLRAFGDEVTLKWKVACVRRDASTRRKPGVNQPMSSNAK